MIRYSEVNHSPTIRSDRGVSGARARGLRQLTLAALALATLALALSQAGRLPGPPGKILRANLAADRDATALFYTEVDNWSDWRERRRH